MRTKRPNKAERMRRFAALDRAEREANRAWTHGLITSEEHDRRLAEVSQYRRELLNGRA